MTQSWPRIQDRFIFFEMEATSLIAMPILVTVFGPSLQRRKNTVTQDKSHSKLPLRNPGQTGGWQVGLSLPLLCSSPQRLEGEQKSGN